MVGIVGHDERDPIVEGHTAQGGVEAAALPLRWREPAKKSERLCPTLAKGVAL